MPFDPSSLARYPEQPGVYLMKDASGAILYIGKAKKLRARLRQYFHTAGDGRAMVPYLTSQVASIDTVVTLTEKEALLLENQLIKKHKPKYNVLLKDDKSFISLLLTDHAWPMLKLVRYKGKPKEKGTYFGPYTNAAAARETFDLLARIFPLRQCSDLEFASRSRPCLLYDIKRCLAPCVGKCTPEAYKTQTEGVKTFLKGKDKEILRFLEKEREKASEALEFERAQELHRTIEQLRSVLETRHTESALSSDCDVFGLHQVGDAALVAKLSFRDGRLSSSEHFSFHSIASEGPELFETFLLQHYPRNEGEKGAPPLLLLPCSLESAPLLEELLEVKIAVPQKGRKKELLEMARRNAEALFLREQDAKGLREKQLSDLQEALGLTRFPKKIVCFDTSHLQGSHPVASLVSFVDGEKEKGGRRLFQIKSAVLGDDYSAMKEALLRYLSKAKEEKTLPDLVIVDGGKGQLHIAYEALLELSIASVDLIAVTKEEARHDRGLTRERIFLPHQKEPLSFEARSPLLFFLQRIRDEAHRQAISYHRKKRSGSLLGSELDDLPGIGPKKKKALLHHFGSVRALKEASQDALEAAPGLTKRDRETLSSWIAKARKKG